MPTIPDLEILTKIIEKPQAFELNDLTSNVLTHNDHILFCNDPDHSPISIGGTNVFLKDLSLAKGININGFALKFTSSSEGVYTVDYLTELTPGSWTLYIASSQDRWGRTSGKLFVSDYSLPSNEILLELNIQNVGPLYALKLATFSLDIKFLGKEDLDYIVTDLVKLDPAVALDVSVFTYRKIVPVNVGSYQVDATFLLLDLRRPLYRRPLGIDYTKGFSDQPLPLGGQLETYQVYVASNEDNWDLINPSYKGQLLFIPESFDPRTSSSNSLFPKPLGRGKTVDTLYVGKVKLGFQSAVSEFDPNVQGYVCDYGEILSSVEANTLGWIPATQIGGYGHILFSDLNNQYRTIGNTTVHVHGLTNLLPAFHYRPCLQYARYTKPVFTRSRLVTGNYVFILTSPQRGWDEVFGLGHSQSVIAVDTSYLLQTEVRLDSIFPIKYKAGDDLQALVLGKGFISVINSGSVIDYVTWDTTFPYDSRASVINGDFVFEGPNVIIGDYTIDYCKVSLLKETKTYRNPVDLIPSTQVGVTNINVLNEIESGTFNVYIAGWTNWYAGIPDGHNYRGQLFLTNVLDDPLHSWFPHTDEFNKTRYAMYVGQWKVDLERIFYPGYDKAAYVILFSDLLDGHDPNLKLDAMGQLYFEDKVGTTRTIGNESVSVEYLDLVESFDVFKPILSFDFNYARGLSLTYNYKNSTVGSYNVGIATYDSDWQKVHPELAGKFFLWSSYGYLDYMKPEHGRDNEYTRRERLPLDLYSLGKYRIDFSESLDPYTNVTGFNMDLMRESKYLFSKTGYERILEFVTAQKRTGIIIDDFGNPWYDKFQDDTLDRTDSWEMEHGGLLENPQHLHVSVFHYKAHFLKPMNVSDTLIEEDFVPDTQYNIYVGSDQSLWNSKTSVGNLYRKSLFLSTMDPVLYIRSLRIDCTNIVGPEQHIESQKIGTCKINLTTKELTLGPQLQIDSTTGDVYYSDLVHTSLTVDGTEVDVTRLSLFEETGRYRLPVIVSGFTGLADLDTVISGDYNVFITSNSGNWDAFCLGYRAQLILSTLESDPKTGLLDIPYKVSRLRAVCVGRVQFIWTDRCIISPNSYQVIKVEPIEIYDPYTVITPDYEVIREMPSCALVHEQFPHPVLWTSRTGPGDYLPAVHTTERAAPENYLTVQSPYYTETFHSDQTVNQRVCLLAGGDAPFVEPGLLIDFSDNTSEFLDSIDDQKRGDGPGETHLFTDIYNKQVSRIRGVGIKNAALTMVGVPRSINDYKMTTIQTTCPTSYTYTFYEGNIYAFGGISTPDTYLGIYDMLSGKSALGTPCPLSRTNHSACAWEGKLYIWGGRTTDFSGQSTVQTNRMFIYDILRDSWTEGTSGGLSGRQLCAYTAYNGKLYFFGGGWQDLADPGDLYHKGYYLNSLDIYDIATDSWFEGLPLQTPSTGCIVNASLTLFNGLLYLYGGTVGVTDPIVYNKILYAYDPVKNAWSEVSNYGASRGKGGTNVIFHNKLYCFSGLFDSDSNADVETYDFATDGWTLDTKDFVMEYSRDIFVKDDKIYFPIDGSQNMMLSVFYPSHKEIFPGPGVYSARTTDLARIDTSTWKGIDRIKTDSILSGNSILAQIFSFDSGSTWKGFYNNVWTTVVRKFNGKWQYLDDSNSFIDEPNDDLSVCLKQSYLDGGRLWTSDSMEAMGYNDWLSNNGFPAIATGTTLDVAVLMKTDSYHFPRLSSYEIILSSWETKSTGGTARSGHSAIVLTGRVFYWGGYTQVSGHPTMLNTMDIYHIDTDTWEVGPTGGTLRKNHTAVLHANWMYVWGGSNELGLLNTLDIYKTGVAQWDTGAQGGTPRELHSAVLYGDKIYFWGGRDASGNALDSLDIFKPLEGLWEIGTSGGLPRYNHTATVIGSKMYIFGGVDQSGEIIPYVDIYDFENDKWDVGAPSSINRKGHVAITYNGLLYVWGGMQHESPVFVLRNETSIYDVSTTIWKDYGSAGGTRRIDAKAGLWQGKMYVWGGVTETGDLNNTIDVCDIANMIKTLAFDSEAKVTYHDDRGPIRYWKRDTVSNGFGGHFEGETKYMDEGAVAINRGNSPNVVALPCRDTGYLLNTSVEIRKTANYSGTFKVVGPEILIETETLDLAEGEYYAYLGVLDDVTEVGSDVVIRKGFQEELFTTGTVNRRVGIGIQGEENYIVPYLKVELEERTNYIIDVIENGRGDGQITLESEMWGNKVNAIWGLEISNNTLGIVSATVFGLELPPTGLYVCYTGDGMQINTLNWTKIMSVAITQNTVGVSTILFLVSFDKRQTYKAFVSGQWKDIVKLDAGIWKYRDTYNMLVPSLKNDLFTALKEAFTVLPNQWNKTSIEQTTELNWDANFGFVPGSLDLAFGFSGATTEDIPSLSAIQIQHEGYSTGTQTITFTSQSDLVREDLKGPIVWWRQDGTDLTQGHFEGVTKKLSGPAIKRASGRVSLPCDAFDLSVGQSIIVRKTVNYDGQYSVLQPYTDIIGAFGEVIFFSKSPTLTGLKLCKVRLTFDLESSLLELPGYVYELYDQSSRYLKTTYNLGRISYYLETIEGQKWLPGVQEALVFAEESLGNSLLVDRQPVLINVTGKMTDAETTTSTTTTTISTTTTTFSTVTTYDPLVLVSSWTALSSNTSLTIRPTTFYKEYGIGYVPASQGIFLFLTTSSTSSYQLIIGGTPNDATVGLYGFSTLNLGLPASYAITMTAFDPVTGKGALIAYQPQSQFVMFTVDTNNIYAAPVQQQNPYSLSGTARLTRAIGNGKIYFFSQSFSTMYIFDLQTSAWSYRALSGNVSSVYGVYPIYHPGTNAIYVCGGYDTNNNYYRDVWKLDLSTYTWSNMGKMASHAAEIVFCAYRNYLIGFGGTEYDQSRFPTTVGNNSRSLILDVSSSLLRKVPTFIANTGTSSAWGPGAVAVIKERNDRVTIFTTGFYGSTTGFTTSSYLNLP